MNKHNNPSSRQMCINEQVLNSEESIADVTVHSHIFFLKILAFFCMNVFLFDALASLLCCFSLIKLPLVMLVPSLYISYLQPPHFRSIKWKLWVNVGSFPLIMFVVVFFFLWFSVFSNNLKNLQVCWDQPKRNLCYEFFFSSLLPSISWYFAFLIH